VDFQSYPSLGEGDIPLFEEALREGTNGLIIAPGNPGALKAHIRKAARRNVPVVCVITDAPQTPRLASVSADPFTVGAIAGELLARFQPGGGKVAFFTGILKHTQNEAGVATVMGHEVAHATQRHGVERISRGLLEQIAQVSAIAGAATGKVDPAVVQGVLSAYGVGVALPFSRVQESEADYIGLRLMAQAGYDPHESIAFWERMSGCPRNMIGKLCFRSGAGVPEFLSTHPSEETRIKNLERWIPQAMQYYNPPPDAPPAAPLSKAMS
jgi:predicted Zn-dependent protease